MSWVVGAPCAGIAVLTVLKSLMEQLGWIAVTPEMLLQLELLDPLAVAAWLVAPENTASPTAVQHAMW